MNNHMVHSWEVYPSNVPATNTEETLLTNNVESPPKFSRLGTPLQETSTQTRHKVRFKG